MTLVMLPASGAWVFCSAEILVRVGGYYVHPTREIAVLRAREDGLDVGAGGDVTPLQRASRGL